MNTSQIIGQGKILVSNNYFVRVDFYVYFTLVWINGRYYRTNENLFAELETYQRINIKIFMIILQVSY